MEREVYIVRESQIVWRGAASGQSTADYFAEAWRRALASGAVADTDAGCVHFRFTPPPPVQF